MKLTEIVQRDPALNQYFQTADKKYSDSYQHALYTSPTDDEKHYLKDGGYDIDRDPIILLFGFLQNNRVDKHERLYLILSSWFEKQFKEYGKRDKKTQDQIKFTIVFYNTLAQGAAYSTFKEIYKTLPIKYFDYLKRIIIVDAGFGNKFYGWMASGTLNNYLHARTVYVDETVHLNNYGIQADKEFRKIIPREILQQQRNKARGLCFQRESLEDDEQNPSKVRLAPQSELTYNNKTHKFYASRLDQYQLSQGKIPVVLRLLINHLSSHQQMLQAPGIFRKAVSIDDQKEADEHLSYKDYNYISKIDDPYLIASIIVRIFSFLRQPIIPYPTYHKLVNNLRQEEVDGKFLQNALSEIPTINQNNLFYLLNFMRTQITPRHEINKMTNYNIAAVLMPALMRSENPLTDLIHAKKCVKILEYMLANCQELVNSRIEKPYQSVSMVSKAGGDTRHTINMTDRESKGTIEARRNNILGADFD